MQSFEYANPSTLKDATAQLSTKWGEASVLAGGTDLISSMKDMIATPKRVVNIKNIKELGGVSKSGSNLRVGAIVTLEELAENAASRDFGALTDAIRGITSPQIRNMGTVGGDLCQRPRCWYFRSGNGLLGMKDGKSLIPEGENRYHAIFPSGSAYFVSASSLAPGLLALGATVTLVSPSGKRQLTIDKLFLAPANNDARETTLAPNEILTEILIPASGMKSATYEVREREAMDWPVAAASVALKMNGAAVQSGRIVLGHVGPTPYLAEKANAMLAGKTLDEKTAEAIGEAAVADAKPLSQNAYKVHLAKIAVKRALLKATGKPVPELV